MNREKLNQIMDLTSNLIKEYGYECIETEWNQHDKILRIYIDSDGGVDLESCANVNRILDANLEFEKMLPNESTLEVSSPGVERPIRRLVDFEKHVGVVVEIKLNSTFVGSKAHSGRLKSVDNEGKIVLQSTTGDVEFLLDNVLKAKVVFEWNK